MWLESMDLELDRDIILGILEEIVKAQHKNDREGARRTVPAVSISERRRTRAVQPYRNKNSAVEKALRERERDPR